MSSDTLEVLDANIVIILEEPLTQTVNAVSLFEGSELASLMKKPLTVSQGLSLDVTLGVPIGMYQIESMRSQKTIGLNSLRIEVHDRSGEHDLEKAKIPETMIELANVFGIEHIKAIGTNWEVAFKLPEGITASAMISEKLLQQDTNFLPQNIRSIGGAARMFLSDQSGVTYVLAIEPRGQNAQTNELWMTCNAQLTNPGTLSIQPLKEMFQQSYQLLFEVKESLFPASQL